MLSDQSEGMKLQQAGALSRGCEVETGRSRHALESNVRKVRLDSRREGAEQGGGF